MKLLAGAPRISGVMIYVSFGKYSVKAVESFEIEGIDGAKATRYATFCFLENSYHVSSDWLVHTIARVHEETGIRRGGVSPGGHEAFGTMEKGMADINRKQSQSICRSS